MPFRSSNDDWEPEDELDDEDPCLDADESTMACPYCGEEIYDESEWCPYCHEYLSREDAPATARPRWIVWGAVACLAIVILWIILECLPPSLLPEPETSSVDFDGTASLRC